MLRHGKYKKRTIVAEGVAITAKTVQKAEEKAQSAEVKKDNQETRAEQQKLFRAWAAPAWR